MASFNEHISQCKNNLGFLLEINARNNGNWDWQVTVCFYTAVHLVNAHIAHVANLHYRTHEHVKNAINPFRPLAPAPVPENVYLAYSKLEGLSRRSRYLCNPESEEERAFLTYDKHFAKAIKNLDILLTYFSSIYSLEFGRLEIICVELNVKTPLSIFKVKVL